MSYVPWDTSIMGELLSNFKISLGNGMVIAVPVFAIIMGITVLIWVIHKFVK